MAELTGADSVEKYIRQADKGCFEVFRANDNSKTPVYRYKGQTAKDAADDFNSWAQIFKHSNEVYRIVVSKGIDDTVDPDNQQKDASKKRWQSVSTTFVLNAINGGMGAPRRDEHGNVVYMMPQQTPPQQAGVDFSKYVAKEEMNAAIAHAVLNAQTQERLRQLEAENLRLYKELYDYEDEDDDEDEISGATDPWKIWSPEKAKEVIAGVRGAVVDVISAVQNKDGPKKLNQVAGPGQVMATIDAGAAPGTYPPYVEPTDSNAELIRIDQQAKINKALPALYKYDMHIGDDLLKLLYIAINKEKTFNNAISQLQEEIVPDSFYKEIMK